MFGQTIFYKVEGMPPERGTMGEVELLIPSTSNGRKV